MEKTIKIKEKKSMLDAFYKKTGLLHLVNLNYLEVELPG